jgi:hypothetical protein
MLAVNIQDFKIKFEVIVHLIQKQLLFAVSDVLEECNNQMLNNADIEFSFERILHKWTEHW